MLRIQTQLYRFDQVEVMGILNATPDSFALHCASLNREDVLAEAGRLIDAGCTILDVGACSTRPGSQPVDEQEEWRRLEKVLGVVRELYPDQIISVDTFRANIAQQAIERYGVQIINDVSGMADERMMEVISRARVPYILTYSRNDIDMLAFFAEQLDRLHRAGVADVILDPGFGFGKTVEQNYAIMHQLPLLRGFDAPILVGVSRKSMLYKPLSITPQEALNATTAMHVLALMNGAHVLRVHDIQAAQQAIQIVQIYKQNNKWNRSCQQ